MHDPLAPGICLVRPPFHLKSNRAVVHLFPSQIINKGTPACLFSLCL